jgi:orotidine-5'-phosphate decarboxylase
MKAVGADRICVALDRGSAGENIALVEQLVGRARWFKVGMRQYFGPGATDVIGAVRNAGAALFLDLKLHDIPKTVGEAAAALSPIAPELLTVHASGGGAMVEAAAEALSGVGTRVLAVTVLTSLDADDLRRMWGVASLALDDAVARLAREAVDAGAGGVVCSAHEAGALRSKLGPEPWLVTPGIRPAGGDAGDQKRVLTAGAAIAAGASLLVVGRPINQAADPVAAFEALAAEPVA